MLLPQAGFCRSRCSGPAPGHATQGAIGFMPHYESAGCGAWHEAASAAGVQLIDPRGNPAAIIAAIGSCRVLLSEAMHGAIVADTLRVPWIALRPLVPLHHAKWHDWAATLDLRVEFEGLAASSLTELLHASPLMSCRLGRLVVNRTAGRVRRLARSHFIAIAARALTQAAAATPQLSEPKALDRCQTRMLERLDAVRRDPRRSASSN
jgi:polysaccharide pyruvyl transferase